MSEHDANRALTDTARMRKPAFVDRLERTQPLPVMTRRFRQHEARVSHELGTVVYDADGNWPVAIKDGPVSYYPDHRDHATSPPRDEGERHARNQRDGHADE